MKTSEDPDRASPLPQISEDDWESIPTHVRNEIAAAFSVVEMHEFRSPLLPPGILQQYDNVVPGLATKLVEWTEQETLHRRQLERDSFEEVRTLRSRSPIIGLAVAVFGLAVAGAVAIFAETGAAVLAACVIAIVSVGGPFAARMLAERLRLSSETTSDQEGG